LEEKVNNSIIENVERQLAKKRQNVLASVVFFVVKKPFKNDVV
jgi:hypothetical protein